MTIILIVEIRLRVSKRIVKVPVANVSRRFNDDVVPPVILKNGFRVDFHAVLSRLMTVQKFLDASGNLIAMRRLYECHAAS